MWNFLVKIQRAAHQYRSRKGRYAKRVLGKDLRRFCVVFRGYENIFLNFFILYNDQQVQN